MSDSKKSRVRFSTEEELILLREVIVLNPFEDFSKWTQVQEKVATATAKNLSVRLVRNHTEHLAKLWQKQDRLNLRKSGTEEQYLEKDQLLQEVCDLMKEFATPKMSKFSNIQIERGVEARNMATEEFWPVGDEHVDCIVIEEEMASPSSSIPNYTLSPPLTLSHSPALNQNMTPVSNLTASKTPASVLTQVLSLNSTSTPSKTHIMTATPSPTSTLTPISVPNSCLTKTKTQSHTLTRTTHPTLMTQIPTIRPVETPRPPFTPSVSLIQAGSPIPTPMPAATSTQNPAPTSIQKPAPTSTQNPSPTSTQNPAPTSTQNPAPTSTQKPAPASTQNPVPTSTQKPAPISTKMPAPASSTPASASNKIPVKTSTPAQTLTPNLTQVLPKSVRQKDPGIKSSTLLYLQEKSKWQKEVEESKMEMKKKKLKLEEEKLSFDRKEREAKLAIELKEREKKLEIEIKEREYRLRMEEAQMQNTTALTGLFTEILKQLKK